MIAARERLRGCRVNNEVVMWHSSANRDESVFDDPNRFDIRRNPNNHLSLG